MCGIIGYVGKREAVPIILKGLHSLEYRGYDSAGVALCENGGLDVIKRKGKVSFLKSALKGKKFGGKTGIGHTRWATHGTPSERNAHPHTDCTGRIALVHNGIIENHEELRDYLKKKNHSFASDTDTETAVHLIEDFLKQGKSFKQALLSSLNLIKGAYAFLVCFAGEPGKLYAARKSSPLMIGVKGSEKFVASDHVAILNETKEVIYLKDGEVAEIGAERISITDLKKKKKPVDVQKLEWNIEEAQKGSFPHFMLKEIYEEPKAAEAAMRGRLKPDKGKVKLGGLETLKVPNIQKIIIVSCGTSYYAGLIGEYYFEEFAGIPTEVHVASEFCSRDFPFEKGTAAVVISQSGETADTLAALKKIKKEGIFTLGIVNVVGSSISRETDAGIYTHAGPEIGVASTKVFISQLVSLALFALYLKNGNGRTGIRFAEELSRIPDKMEIVLKDAGKIKKLAAKYKKYPNFLFLGRRYSYPVAMEGALKLKEISYLHAEGYGAGEMKHGPIALIDKSFPTVAVVPKNSVSAKMYSNIEEIKSRSGKVFAIATEGDRNISRLADDVFYVPKTIEPLEPFLTVIPLHLFAYYIGTGLGYDVDKPRNLAKSVTVE